MPTDILLIKAPIPDNVDDYDCYDDYEYVKKYFPEMFPVVGDILVGKVISEKEYGYWFYPDSTDTQLRVERWLFPSFKCKWLCDEGLLLAGNCLSVRFE